MKIITVLTCHNRKNYTKRCIETLILGNSNVQFTFVVVDDGSTDGTLEMLNGLSSKFEVYVLLGEGSLYYSGGMRMGMDYVLRNLKNIGYDYLLLVNDDVEFFNESIERLLIRSCNTHRSVVAGATCNLSGRLSYGAIKYICKDKIKYRRVRIDEENLKCDTFNANCVLIPFDVFLTCGSFDSHYVHSLGDLDYGLTIKNHGYSILSSDEYVGICENNNCIGSVNDKSLSVIERLKLKESPKGAPFKPWFYFLKKNFNLSTAIIRSITPYIKILLRI